jgi:hypothetical protein
MPVSIPPIDGKVRTALAQLRLQRCDQFSRLLVDWTLAFEVVIVVRHRQQAFARDLTSAKYRLAERNYVFATFGSAEGDNENSVITRSRGLNLVDSNVPRHARRIQLSHVNEFCHLIAALSAAIEQTILPRVRCENRRRLHGRGEKSDRWKFGVHHFCSSSSFVSCAPRRHAAHLSAHHAPRRTIASSQCHESPVTFLECGGKQRRPKPRLA